MTETQPEYTFTPTRFPCGRETSNRLLEVRPGYMGAVDLLTYGHAFPFYRYRCTIMQQTFKAAHQTPCTPGCTRIRRRHHWEYPSPQISPDHWQRHGYPRRSQRNLPPFKNIVEAIRGGSDGVIDPSHLPDEEGAASRRIRPYVSCSARRGMESAWKGSANPRDIYTFSEMSRFSRSGALRFSASPLNFDKHIYP